MHLFCKAYLDITAASQQMQTIRLSESDQKTMTFDTNIIQEQMHPQLGLLRSVGEVPVSDLTILSVSDFRLGRNHQCKEEFSIDIAILVLKPDNSGLAGCRRG